MNESPEEMCITYYVYEDQKLKIFRLSGVSRWEKKVESESAKEKIVLY